MTADMHANWKEKVMEKFLNNATEMRGAETQVTKSLSRLAASSQAIGNDR